MTDQTPRTEAGRLAQSAVNYLSNIHYHEVYEDGSNGGDYIEVIDILAIEAEAAAQARTEVLDVEVLARALRVWRGDFGEPLEVDIPDASDLAAAYRAILAARRDEG